LQLPAEQEQLVEIRFTAEDGGTTVELTGGPNSEQTSTRSLGRYVSQTWGLYLGHH
jgi:hypothetical protein